MTRHHIGLPHDMGEDDVFRGMSRELRSRAFAYEALGFGTLGLIVDVMLSTDEDARRMQEGWENILLIRHQHILFAYGYNQEEQQQIRQHLEQLRVAGRYAEEFALYGS
jgi:hypothetical protein